MKRVFISHPYSDDPEGSRRRVERICRYMTRTMHYALPISPVHLFSFYEDDAGVREEILEFCYRMIDNCDQVFAFGDSDGCRKEIAYARKQGIPVYGVWYDEQEDIISFL